MQNRKHSALETVANVSVGYIAAVMSQATLFPVFGISAPARTNIVLGAWFTVISLVRSYTMRRMFARWEGR